MSSFADAVSLLREPTKGQWTAFSAAWIGWVLDAFDFTIFFLVMPQIAKEFGVNHVATTGSIALTLLARFAGGWLAGIAADRWGRRLPLLLSVVWFALCDGAVALAPSFTAVLVLRTLFGVGMGAEWTSGTTLAMESWPRRSRAIASGVLQGSWAVGYILAGVVSAFVLPRFGWRAMFVIAALPALLALPMRWWIPESEEHQAAKAEGVVSLGDAFRTDKTLFRRVVWGCFIMAFGFGAYYGLTGLYPTMLREELGLGDGGIARLVTVFNVGMLIGSVAVGILTTRRGATVGIALPALLAVLAVPVYTGLAFEGRAALTIGAFLGGAIGTAFCGATPVVLTDLFPAAVRARLVGVVYHVGAFFAAFVPMAIAALARSGMGIAKATTLVAIACELTVFVLVAGRPLAVRIGAAMRGRSRAAASASVTMLLLVFVATLASSSSTACLTSNVDPFATDGGTAGAKPPVGDADVCAALVTLTGAEPPSDNGVAYRSLFSHPGCTTDGLSTRAASAYPAAQIPCYRCAAKAYPTNNEDPKKPIVLLVHGNSSTPADYEKFPADKADAQTMLSERLVEAGYKVLAVDLRYDKVDDPKGDNKTENAAQNYDHGWGVPILEHFVDAVMTAYPGREISMVSFSVGPTMVRDSLRRLHRRGTKPFERIRDLIYVAGAHHGVSTFRALCASNPTMRGRITCELGDRTAYEPTAFLKPLNGPNGEWETPCGDGDSAFGQKGACGGHKVWYTTLVMKDVSQGTFQDEFVSEGSSALSGAKNLTVSLQDNDTSGYFYNGIFKNHYGALRSEAALKILMDALSD